MEDGYDREYLDDDDDLEDEERRAVVPQDLKNLRACLRCYLVKTDAQFAAEGYGLPARGCCCSYWKLRCENCPFLRINEDRDRLWSCTTNSFEGVISMMIPTESWVARWQVMNPRGGQD